MVNKFNLYGMFTLFLLIVIARLHVRDCPTINPMISLTMTFVAAPRYGRESFFVGFKRLKEGEDHWKTMRFGLRFKTTTSEGLISISIIFFLVWYHRAAFREATRRVTEDFKHAFDDNI